MNGEMKVVYDEGYMSKTEAICPVCGKVFYPSGEWVYRIGKTFNAKEKKVCSYGCMRKHNSQFTEDIAKHKKKYGTLSW